MPYIEPFYISWIYFLAKSLLGTEVDSMTEPSSANIQLEKSKLISEDSGNNCLNSPVDRIFLAVLDFFGEGPLGTEVDSMTEIEWLTKKNH